MKFVPTAHMSFADTAFNCVQSSNVSIGRCGNGCPTRAVVMKYERRELCSGCLSNCPDIVVRYGFYRIQPRIARDCWQGVVVLPVSSVVVQHEGLGIVARLEVAYSPYIVGSRAPIPLSWFSKLPGLGLVT